MRFQKIVNENERLSILHCLAEMDDYSANNSIITDVCADYGNRFTSDKLLTHLAWLSEQGLVTLKDVGNYKVATMTARGLDCEKGLARTPGVKRPGPGA
jgi:hypothetical protein